MIQAECGITIQDFGDQLETECPRGVNGVVWNDLNGNGTLDSHEPPLSGATLTLRDSAEEIVGIQVTEHDGIYLFENLAADVYFLFEDNPPGFPISTTPDPWGVDLTGCRVWTINFGDQATPGQ